MKKKKAVIIGAGPAGLAAGLYSGRSRLSTLIIEKGKDGGQIAITNEIENYPGFPEGATGLGLMELFHKQAKKFGVKFKLTDVKGVSLEGEKGVYDIVNGNKSFEESVKYIERYNLYLLVASAAVPDPSETLASASMEKIIETAKANFDYVIIDCPPAGVVADAAIVANYTDTMIFVTAEERVAIPQIEYALSDLMTTKADILGCIYNRAGTGTLKVATEKAGGYFSNRYGGYYGSSYYYGSRSSHHHRKRK